MATITTINASDYPADSRAVINTNFTNLNTDKAELDSPTFTGTPSLPTGTTGVTQSANDNSTKLATTAYVETATSNLVEAPTVLTAVPEPLAKYGAISNTTFGDTTTAKVTLYSIREKITVNKISVMSQTVSTGDTLDITVYSENGQTQLFSVTTASIASSTTPYTTAVSAVVLDPGNYYILTNANSGTPNLQLSAYETNASPFATATTGSLSDVTSEPVLTGTLAISAGTPPATITPGSITPAVTGSTLGRAIVFRLDN
jgi:hypothetical protein